MIVATTSTGMLLFTIHTIFTYSKCIVMLHFQELRRALLSTLGSSTGVGSVALNGGGANSPARSRAVAEAVLVWRVMLRLREELRRVGMWSSFQGELPRCFTAY